MPDDVDARSLDPEVRAELRSLAKDTADLVAKHLVLTGQLVDDDPRRALAHARAAGALAGRVGSVREALGLAAYTAGEWAEALSELRTARRITGRSDHLAVMADCERALGRPERALAHLDDPDVPRLDQSARVELVIVVAGARRDLGQPAAAVVLLQPLARVTAARHPWAPRLWYAYADALLADGRAEQAREWFQRVVELDPESATDADERLLEIDGVVLQDLQDEGPDEDADADGPGADLSPTELAELAHAALAAHATAEHSAVQHPAGERAPLGQERPNPAGPPDDAVARPAFTDGAEPAQPVPAPRPVPAVAFAPPQDPPAPPRPEDGTG